MKRQGFRGGLFDECVEEVAIVAFGNNAKAYAASGQQRRQVHLAIFDERH
jgi:hypothetical protein